MGDCEAWRHTYRSSDYRAHDPSSPPSHSPSPYGPIFSGIISFNPSQSFPRTGLDGLLGTLNVAIRSTGYYALATIWFAAESKKPGYGGDEVDNPCRKKSWVKIQPFTPTAQDSPRPTPRSFAIVP